MYHGTGDILGYTAQQFDLINFNELNTNWIEELIDNEFSQVDENSITTSILFVNDDPLQTLRDIANVCMLWCNRTDISSLHESRLGNASTNQEEFLWTYLSGMDISVQQVLGFVYLLCSKASKPSSSIEDKELGIATANFYFCCLIVPGTSVYSAYYPMLFRVCVDCLYIPEHIPDTRDTTWKQSESLLPVTVTALDSLVPLLSTFHLGTDTSCCDHVIKKLSELVSWELLNSSIDFSVDYVGMNAKERRRKFSFATIVTVQSYQGLLTLIEIELNGDREHNYSWMLNCLNRHVLLTRLKKKQSITQKMLVVKDNVVAFVCHTLKGLHQETCSRLCVEALKRLCLSVGDKVDLQSIVSQTIFKVLFHLNIEEVAEFVQWLLLLADSELTGNRTFGLDALGRLLGNVPQFEMEKLPENLHVFLTPLPIIFSLLTRCDDISPSVRTRALTIISDHMAFILPQLQNMKDLQMEQFDDDIVDSHMNGDHRVFWYNLQSFREVLDEIAAILLRRISDNNVSARKGALQALENLINFDLTYLSDVTLKLFHFASKDAQVSVRKQMIQSLTSVLNVHHAVSEAQDCWLRCVLPLVHDPETTSQAKVLQVMEERFLHHVFLESDAERRCAFTLLGKLSTGEFLSHQRYLQKAFSLWHKEKKLRPQMISNLEKHFDSDMRECVFFYISLFSAFSKIPPRISEIVVNELHSDENWDNYVLMEHILKILSTTFWSLSKDQVKDLKTVCMARIQDLSAPVELLPLLIDILFRIQKHLQCMEEFEAFATSSIQNSIEVVQVFLPNNTDEMAPPDEHVSKHLTLLKEFCQMFPKHIKEDLIKALKTMVYSENSYGLSKSSKKVSTLLRAHSFAALGKLSLQDETLAKDLLPVMAKELMTSSQDVIRNNVVITMIEMCKRYTSHADKYVPLISLCFKDRVFIIRYQAITMLVSLLQEDYIKWKGGLFFCLLSTVNDKKDAIVELGKYCLTQLLLEKKKDVFSDHFLDSLFVFNHYAPPDNDRLSKNVKELERFAILGEDQRDQRMQIYKFMLDHTEVLNRTLIVKQLCNEVLGSVAGSVFPLNPTTECIVRDCFAILACKEIGAFDPDTVGDDLEEVELESAKKAELAMRRVVLIEPVIPVAIALRNTIAHSKSNLLKDLILFLKDILQDFSSSLGDLLAADKTLERQVLREYQVEAMQLEREAKERNKKETRKANQNQPASGPPRATTYDNLARRSQNFSALLLQEKGQPPMTPPRRPSSAIPEEDEDEEVFTVNGCRVTLDSQRALRNDTKVTSTPHVVLRPLRPYLDISNINLDDDEEMLVD